FHAAPFTRLSETTHKWNPLSASKSLRIRPTNTSFFSSALNGVGYVWVLGSSSKTIPSPLLIVFLNVSTDTFGSSISTKTLSEREETTGNLTQVAATPNVGSCVIFFVPLIIFSSSFVNPVLQI